MFVLVVLISMHMMAPNVMTSSALSCVEPPPIEQLIEDYDGIVSAEVLSIQEDPHVKRLELDIIASYKGVQEPRIEVQENLTWGTSVVGETYLFFLQQTDSGWEIPLCSATEPIHQSTERLAHLERMEIPIEPVDDDASTVDDDASTIDDDASTIDDGNDGELEENLKEDLNKANPNEAKTVQIDSDSWRSWPIYVAGSIAALSVVFYLFRRFR